MRAKSFIWIVVVLTMIGAAAHAGVWQGSPEEAFVGVWSGEWQGEGRTGGFELTLERAAEGGLGGRVSVTGEPTYKTSLRTLSFERSQMSARYDFPSDDNVEIVLTATFNDKSAKGTWAARVKASGDEVARGTWTVTRR